LEKVEPKDFARAYAFWSTIPLRASASELSLLLPQRSASATEAAGSEATAVRIETGPTTTRRTQGGEDEVVNSWKIASDLGITCQEAPSSATNFEYTSNADGEPISEFITVTCGQQHENYLGVLYHEIRFVDGSELPPNFFDPDSARSSLIADEMSSAAAQLGSVFWLGDQAGGWTLTGAEHDAGSARVGYSRGNGSDAESVELTTRAPGIGYRCENGEPIPNDAYGGSLCRGDGVLTGYRIVWTPPGFDLWLEKQSYPREIGRDDVLALAARLQQWERHAPGPLLTGDDVRNLVADSLEMVCPGKLRQIREARSASSFSFDRQSGEWTGAFGSFGNYAVPDSKPVAIPVSQRKEVESTLSHNAAQFADCVLDEQPPPQEGDDTFGVKFTGSDDSGFAFEITGVDPGAEAALSICLTVDRGSCGLTDPGGTSVGSGMEMSLIRPKVYRIHVGLAAEELHKPGAWIFALDLGNSRTARATFDVR
jgi:hypothetical protein